MPTASVCQGQAVLWATELSSRTPGDSLSCDFHACRLPVAKASQVPAYVCFQRQTQKTTPLPCQEERCNWTVDILGITAGHKMKQKTAFSPHSPTHPGTDRAGSSAGCSKCLILPGSSQDAGERELSQTSSLLPGDDMLAMVLCECKRLCKCAFGPVAMQGWWCGECQESLFREKTLS